MSTFTMYLHEVIEDTGGELTVAPDGVSRMTGGNIGLNYLQTPFDTDYKDILIGKIIDNFYNREIGQETISMFQLAMRRKTALMMPQFNQLYESTKIQFDPLSTIDIKSVSTGQSVQAVTAESDSISNSEQSSKSRAVSSDTPQTMLSGNGDYASSAADSSGSSDVDATNSEQNKSDSTTENEGESSTTGYNGLASDLLIRYRESIINVDKWVIDSYNDCFMQVWDNADSYTNRTNGYY